MKLRGLRVEPGEIESVLNSYPGVKTSIVVVDREAECLAAYFTADRPIPLNDLKEHLSAYLTAYMVPQAIRQLDEMPLTANGKIDKKALPAIVHEQAERHIEYPVTDLQQRLREELADETLNQHLSLLVDYDLDGWENLEEIPAENGFTVNALYHLGFQWTITDMNIIEAMIEALRTLRFFDILS